MLGFGVGREEAGREDEGREEDGAEDEGREEDGAGRAFARTPCGNRTRRHPSPTTATLPTTISPSGVRSSHHPLPQRRPLSPSCSSFSLLSFSLSLSLYFALALSPPAPVPTSFRIQGKYNRTATNA